MAFSNTLNSRLDDMRFSSMRSPEIEVPYTAALTSQRDSNPFFAGLGTSTNDVRSTLQRRFTTESKLSMKRASFGQQQYSSMNSNGVHTKQMDQKQLYEDIQMARRKAREQLALLDLRERELKLGNAVSPDLERLNGGFTRMSLNGPVSEPTTPPDYSDDAFSNRLSRSSRISMNNISSPPGLMKRVSQTGNKVTSPPGTRSSASGLYSSHRQSTKSMPGSRRGSDEEEDYLDTLPTSRAAGTPNRFSMPVNGSRNTHHRHSVGQTHGVGPQVDTSFLLEDNDPLQESWSALTGGDDGFPTLTSDGVRLSANPAALDLANSTFADEDWVTGSRPRRGHASMPQTSSNLYRPNLNTLSSPPDRSAEPARPQSQRHSMGVTFDDSTPLPTSSMPPARPASLQTSYSTPSVPTLRQSIDIENSSMAHRSQGESQFHAHNVSLGRIPVGAVNNRQSREATASGNGFHHVNNRSDENLSNATSNLQANATPFGPPSVSTADSNGLSLASVGDNNFSQPPMYQYNMQNYNVGQVQMQPGINGAVGFPQQSGMMAGYGRQNVGPRRYEESRFNGTALEIYQGQIYDLCKDQHGCRYLQRKLEDGEPAHVQLIFVETCPHIIELMTDPFGNYLCQKLFEHCNDDQRTTLIDTAAPALTVVALNQHGTRALQKMIEFVHTDNQINTIIQALSGKVVDLVQDLNGNHVIQKCLTRLGAETCHFIYEAVGRFCVVVGTHRHGCCVLQRCIDHAGGVQRDGLIHQITLSAFDLVQDPFGNYVVQYILDLDEVKYTRPLCRSFRGKVVGLSKQKFSSNVIEKCLRVADLDTKRLLIEEMMAGNELEKMLRDSFANYVVQTALDYADVEVKNRMIDMIRPILPAIKQTPHGRRIASKISTMTAASAAPVMAEPSHGNANFGTGRSTNRRQIQINGGGFYYGGHGVPSQERPAEDYGSGQSGVVHPLGYNPGENGFSNNYSHVTGNYI